MPGSECTRGHLGPSYSAVPRSLRPSCISYPCCTVHAVRSRYDVRCTAPRTAHTECVGALNAQPPRYDGVTHWHNFADKLQYSILSWLRRICRYREGSNAGSHSRRSTTASNSALQRHRRSTSHTKTIYTFRPLHFSQTDNHLA